MIDLIAYMFAGVLYFTPAPQEPAVQDAEFETIKWYIETAEGAKFRVKRIVCGY